MAEFYRINMNFCVPIRGDCEDDSLDLLIGDIIEVRFLMNDSSLIKKLGSLGFLDTYLYEEFMMVNSKIFENITIAYLRDKKINSLIKKST